MCQKIRCDDESWNFFDFWMKTQMSTIEKSAEAEASVVLLMQQIGGHAPMLEWRWSHADSHSMFLQDRRNLVCPFSMAIVPQ